MSILNSIKAMLGIESDITAFDYELMTHINTVFSILYQLGLGDQQFIIVSAGDNWDEYFSTVSSQSSNLEFIKTYMYMKVKMIFDPPSSSIAAESFKNLIQEMEWRINSEVDPERNSQ